MRLAASGGAADRADAGRALVRFVDVEGVRATLVALILDQEDTLVTLETATALCGRKDAAGLAVVAEAMAAAAEDQLLYIAQAVTEVYGIYATDRDEALRQAPPGLLAEWLAEISPVLHPL